MAATRPRQINCRNCSTPIMVTSGRQTLCRECRLTELRIRANAPENVLKRKAQIAVTAAIRRGELVRRSCEGWSPWRNQICGDQRTHAHHEDYSRPLDVIWLCSFHHISRHQELRSSPIPPINLAREHLAQPDRDW